MPPKSQRGTRARGGRARGRGTSKSSRGGLDAASHQGNEGTQNADQPNLPSDHGNTGSANTAGAAEQGTSAASRPWQCLNDVPPEVMADLIEKIVPAATHQTATQFHWSQMMALTQVVLSQQDTILLLASLTSGQQLTDVEDIVARSRAIRSRYLDYQARWDATQPPIDTLFDLVTRMEAADVFEPGPRLPEATAHPAGDGTDGNRSKQAARKPRKATVERAGEDVGDAIHDSDNHVVDDGKVEHHVDPPFKRAGEDEGDAIHDSDNHVVDDGEAEDHVDPPVERSATRDGDHDTAANLAQAPEKKTGSDNVNHDASTVQRPRDEDEGDDAAVRPGARRRRVEFDLADEDADGERTEPTTQRRRVESNGDGDNDDEDTGQIGLNKADHEQSAEREESDVANGDKHDLYGNDEESDDLYAFVDA
ncbi:unnamed protein product [Parajaminaea phylloscopi]